MLSDSEDDDMLEDIRALEKVLASTEPALPFSPDDDLVYNKSTSGTSVTLPPDVQIQDDNERNDNDLTYTALQHAKEQDPSVNEALSINKKLLSCLLIAKEKITSLILECDKKMKLIDERLQQHATSSTKTMITPAGMPYFKDKDHFAAPKNEIAKLKAARGELNITTLPKIHRWTLKDRRALAKAIQNEAISNLLKGQDEKAEVTVLQPEDDRNLSSAALPEDFRSMVGPLGTKEFDWLKIAAVDFDCRHSAEECRVMWNVFLHPDINKSKWKKAEDEKLKQLAISNNLQDWERIAQDLGTRRTAYQCFIRYNTRNSRLSRINASLWTKLEDDKLMYLINQLRIGDYIPWAEISRHINTRTKSQVYHRWVYSLAPHLRKGRFTQEEDETLLAAVEEFGANFSKISAVCMPHRHSAQLSDHYQTLVFRKQGNNRWSADDDEKLIDLYNTFGPNWSKIAENFTDKHRTHVRHRHTALQKHLQRGVGIGNVRRQCEQRRARPYVQIDNRESKTCTRDVDKELLDYFCFTPEAKKVGRRQRRYEPEQLAAYTEKLYGVLKTLGANLEIPEDLDNSPLSEKDKQLLSSLKEYTKRKTDPRSCSELVEEIRQKMFPTNIDDKNDHELKYAISCTSRAAQNSRSIGENIDYVVDVNVKNTVDVAMEFITPREIISLIGTEKHMQFQNVSDSLLIKSPTSDKRGAIQRLYIIPPQMLQGCSIQQRNRTSNLEMSNLFIHFDDVPYIGHRQADTSVQSTENLRYRQDPVNIEKRFDIIRPSNATVIAFKNLLCLKDIEDVNTVPRVTSNTRNSDECNPARSLLKRRLLQLFKYPIGMSRTFVPHIHGADSIFMNNIEEGARKRRSNAANKKNKKCKIKSEQHQDENMHITEHKSFPVFLT